MEELEINWKFKTAKARFTLDYHLCMSGIPDDIPLPLFYAPGSLGEVGWAIRIQPDELDFSKGSGRGYRFLRFTLGTEGPTFKNLIVCANIEVFQISSVPIYEWQYVWDYPDKLTQASFSLNFDSGVRKFEGSTPLHVGQVAFLNHGGPLTVSATIKYCVADNSSLYKIFSKTPEDPAKQQPVQSQSNRLPVVKKLRVLLSTSELSDATLSVGGTDLPVHRAVLAAQSAFFKAAFQGKEDKANVRVDFKEHYSLPVVRRLLRSLYFGRVELDLEDTVELLVVTDRLGVPELRAKCEEFLADAMLAGAMEDPGAMLCDVLRAAALLDCEPLHKVAIDHLRDNQTTVVVSSPWVELCETNRGLAGAALVDALAVRERPVDQGREEHAGSEHEDEGPVVEYRVGWNFRTATVRYTLHHDVCFNQLPDEVVLPPFYSADLAEVGWVFKIRPDKTVSTAGKGGLGYRVLIFYLYPETAVSMDVIAKVILKIGQKSATAECLGKYCEAYKTDLHTNSFSDDSWYMTMMFSTSDRNSRFSGEIAFMDEAGNELTIEADIKHCVADSGRILYENVIKAVPKFATPASNSSKQAKPSPPLSNKLPVLKGLRALLSTGELSDATLCVGGTDLPVHRAVLAAQSAFFKAAFQGKASKPGARVDFKDHYSLPVVRRLLRALYSGRVQLDLEHAVEMLVAAVKLGVPDLRKLCEKFLEDAMVAADLEDPGAMLCDVLRAAALLDCEPLRKVAVDHLRHNQAVVLASSAWAELCHGHRALAGAALVDALLPLKEEDDNESSSDDSSEELNEDDDDDDDDE